MDGADPGVPGTVLPQQHREALGTQSSDFKIISVSRDRTAI